MEEQSLDDILESALDDFEEEEETTSSSKSSSKTETKTESNSKKEETKEEKKNVNSNSNSNSKDEESDKLVSEEVKKLMESLVQTGELEKGLEEILKSLDINEDALGNIPSLEELQNVDEETMEKILSEIEQKPEMVKAVEDMMGAFMSKDLMYEPMKEIRDRYPKWLEENKAKLSSQEFANYVKQFGCVKKMCDVYENDPNNVAKLMTAMTEMQETGQPPSDLLKSISAELGSDGGPDMSQLLDSKNCNVM